MSDITEKPEDSKFNALTQAAFRLSNLLTAQRDNLAAEFGLSSARWQILENLAQQNLSQSAAQIGRNLQISRQAVQRILNDLAKLELVVFANDKQDKRAKKVALTEKGRTILAKLTKRSSGLREKLNNEYPEQISDFLMLANGHGLRPSPEQHGKENRTIRDSAENQDTKWSTRSFHDSPEANPRTFETIKGQILSQIREGNLSTGDRLPPEREIASRLKVGRSAVREALRSLEMAGVLRFKRGAGGGAFIRESGSDGIEASIRSMLILGRLPLRDLLDLRTSLLSQCARLGAERGNEEDFSKLEDNINALEMAINSTNDYLIAIVPATDFYRLAAASTHNPLMMLLVDAIANLVREMLMTLQHRPREDFGSLAAGNASRHA